MITETRTHWKKNNDSRYISGEDLQDGVKIGKGLKPVMIVEAVRFEDSETFDKKAQETIIKTGFYLKDLESNKMIYKPVILNNSNGEFCIKEFGSDIMEDWLNKPFVLFAKPDKRHGFVARFRKHFPKATTSPANATKIMNTSTTLDELKANWSKLTPSEQALPVIMKLKEDLKTKLS
tara:strand:+ start:402 stop:935 length:534 start_codon:yes stop_codon:yes gene_type:complete